MSSDLACASDVHCALRAERIANSGYRFGLHPDKIATIFFRLLPEADSEHDATFGGAGLGLTICKRSGREPSGW